MNRYIIQPADQDAFDAFVELLHAKVPHTGWQSVTQLPPLSPWAYAHSLERWRKSHAREEAK